MYNLREAKYVSIYLNIVVFLAAFVSIVLWPAYSITVPAYVLVYLGFPLIFWHSMHTHKQFVKEFFFILLIYVVLNGLAQLNNVLSHLQLNDVITLTEPGNTGKVILRPTLFSQSVYLFAGILLYLYLKYYGTKNHLNIYYWALRVLVAYGFLEVIIFQITGHNGDFLSNREFNHVPGTGSLFQTMLVGGHVIQRLKSLTGEPSMFALTIVPFWILATGLKRKIDVILFLIALILTFSTSAFLGIFIFLCAWFARKAIKDKKWLLVFPAAIVVLAIILFIPSLHNIFNEMIWYKITGANQSGSDRSSFFHNHITYWKNLNFPGKLFGIGFGYIRSTDFFSTLLVNNGIIGILVFTIFFFKHAYVKFIDKNLKYYYVTALVATYLIMMVSVPEFAYLSTWILLALPYVVKRNQLLRRNM